MNIKTTTKQSLIDSLKKYHDISFTPGIYEHSIFGQAALLLEKEAGCCEQCEYFREKRVVAICNHPHGLKNPERSRSCCFIKPRQQPIENEETS